MHTGSYVDPSGTSSGTTPRCARSARGCCRCSRRVGDDDAPVAAARADRRPGPLAVRRRRRPRALPRRARPPPQGRHLPGHLPRLRRRRAARRARRHRPRPSTGSSRSAAPAGCGWSTPTTRWTSAARSRTGTRSIGEGHIGLDAFARAVRPPGHRRACRSSWRRPAPATPATRRLALLKKLREREPRVSERRTSLLATLALLAITATWGSTFFLIKDLLDRVPVLDFLAVRFAIATRGAARWSSPRALRRLSADVAPARGRCSALLYGVAQILQTAGLAHTAGQRVGLHHRHVRRVHAAARGRAAAAPGSPPMTWGAVALATAGLGGADAERPRVGYGEAITLVAAVLYALHIVGLGAWSTPAEAMGMSIVQLAGDHGGLLRRHRPRRHRAARRRPATGCRWSTWRCSPARSRWSARPGRRRTCRPPARAIIMSMEPVFAAFFAVLARRRDADRADARRRRDGARRDAGRRAAARAARSRPRSRTSPSDARSGTASRHRCVGPGRAR